MKTLLAMTSMMLCFSLTAVCEAQQRQLTFEMILEREDTNNDGKISREEYKGPGRLFQRLDQDKDDILTKKEFDAARARFNGMNRQGNNPNRQGNAPTDVDVHRDVVFGTGGGRDLKMHIVTPKNKAAKPAPVYVWIHGGGWMGGTKEGGVRQVVPVVRQGFVGATIEYRLTGEAPFPAQIEDCKCAIRFLRAHAEEYNIDPNRIAVGGSSAGGHLVALLGTSGGVKELEGQGGWADQSSTVQAVIDLFGPTDFKAFVSEPGYEHHNKANSPESRLLGGGEVLPNTEGIKRVNPITYIDAQDPPFLIIHGTQDRTVPLNQSELLNEALTKVGVSVKLHKIEGAGHGGPDFSKPEINDMKLEFLKAQFFSDKE